MVFGYARVSTQDQNLDHQLDELTQSGCERIYQEKVTGKNTDRPELDKLLNQLRPLDTVIVTELSRLSRSVRDLFSLVDTIHQKGAHLKSLKQTWLDTTTPQGKLLFTIFAGVSEFERDLISQRTKEGLASARARGRKGGRPKLADSKIQMALTLYQSGKHSISFIVNEAGISKASLYRAIRGSCSNSAENKEENSIKTVTVILRDNIAPLVPFISLFWYRKLSFR